MTGALEDPIMKLSARNMLSGTVLTVTKGTTTAHVTVDVGGQTVTSAIKSSDVMIGVD